MNKTPETDKIIRNAKIADHPPTRLAATLTVKCEKLERERNEAREALENEMKWHHRTHAELVQTQCKLLDMQMGRDEIQGKYDNLATEHMLVVNKICNERDNALKALMEIEDLFIDGTDVYEDKEKMGKIAIVALEENNE